MSQRTVLFPQTFLSFLLFLFCATYGFCDPLVNFQVTQPPPFVLDSESLQCTIPILQRTFGNSVGEYALVPGTVTRVYADACEFQSRDSPVHVRHLLSPPTSCSTPNEWAGVTLNLTVTSTGTQYSRFGFLTLQDVEIWRTSTAMPVEGDGIIWTQIKDVTRFIPLFTKPGTFVLQLDNAIQPGDDGEYTVTLDATIFSGSSQFPPAQRADLIVPLTTLANNTGSEASVPPGFWIEVTLPQNAVTAFAEFQASASNKETYWYAQIPKQFSSYFSSGVTGDGPFREVRILVDGQVAGVAFPYPVLLTEGVLPPAWRPIAPYGALDMPTYHLDLTPFIPILTNGAPHNITIDVASAEPDHQTNQTWFLSGLLQVNLDSSTLPTTGNITLYQASDYATSTASGSSNNDVVNINVDASRSIHIEAEIVAGSGERNKVVFTQNLEYRSTRNLDYSQAPATIQHVSQIASGETLSTHNGEIVMQDTFTYPITIDIVATPDGSNVHEWAQVDHAYDRMLLPAPFITGSTIIEHQVAGGTEDASQSSSTGSNGTSSNTFNYFDTEGNTYMRQVNASSNVITFDNQGGNLAPGLAPSASPTATATAVP
ncbi:peptide N-acetyl-beta-D-glucosaminyl asparaginase amidase A-domain-containing protein [Lactarius indigo]|nr:peptide N-acetyl-beta-D-glucosaminyl asparaginase amidase A-domain-containing protein [Lactarius indigo]